MRECPAVSFTFRNGGGCVIIEYVFRDYTSKRMVQADSSIFTH